MLLLRLVTMFVLGILQGFAMDVERIIKATAFSASGLRAAWVNEAAFRQECALAAVLIPIAFWIGPSAVERELLIGS